MKRVTRVELNKRARHKKLLRAEAKAKEVEALSKEIDWYSDIPTCTNSISVGLYTKFFGSTHGCYVLNFVWFFCT